MKKLHRAAKNSWIGYREFGKGVLIGAAFTFGAAFTAFYFYALITFIFLVGQPMSVIRPYQDQKDTVTIKLNGAEIEYEVNYDVVLAEPDIGVFGNGNVAIVLNWARNLETDEHLNNNTIIESLITDELFKQLP